VQNVTTASLARPVRVNVDVRCKRSALKTLVVVPDHVLLAGMAQTARQVGDTALKLVTFTTLRWHSGKALDLRSIGHGV